MVSKNQIKEKLKTVIDPEIGISVIDLGLIYRINIENSKVKILATLTTPFCPLGPTLIKDIKDALKSLEGVEGVEVEITFDPPWDISKISPKARKELGIQV